MPNPSPKLRRRWFSLSIRGLMIVILIVGGLMGWKARRAGLQRRAVAAIQALGGNVGYDWQVRATSLETRGPAWLRKTLGDEYFQDVARVELPDNLVQILNLPLPPEAGPGETRESDIEAWSAREAYRKNKESAEALSRDDLACLEGLDRIESLALWGPPLKTAGLARLGRLSSLKALTSINAPMGVDGFEQVAKLSELEFLSIQLNLHDASSLAPLGRLAKLNSLGIFDLHPSERRYPPSTSTTGLKSSAAITDNWLVYVGKLPNLLSLSIHGTEITDDGLVHLKGLDKLEHLSLAYSFRITDAGLALLKVMKSLTALDLDAAAEITDRGLAQLKDFPSLEDINLASASKVTDSGVESMAKIPRLQSVELNAKSVSDDALIRLASLPKLVELRITGREISGEILKRMQATNSGLTISADQSDGSGAIPAILPRPNANPTN